MSNQSWNIMIQRIAFFGLGAFAAVLLVSTAVFDPTLCEGANCKMEWISALSGYVAALGALVAAGLTLPPLLRQAREAKRQTDFIVGDAKPTFRIEKTAPMSFSIRCVNWNRRDFLISEIVFSDRQGTFGQRAFDAIPDEGSPRQWGHFMKETLYGWEDRTKKPRSVKFKFEIQDRTEDQRSDRPQTVKIIGSLAGEEAIPIEETFDLTSV